MENKYHRTSSTVGRMDNKGSRTTNKFPRRINTEYSRVLRICRTIYIRTDNRASRTTSRYPRGTNKQSSRVPKTGRTIYNKMRFFDNNGIREVMARYQS